MSSKIIEFKNPKDEELIEFEGYMKVDGYLKLTCINALERAGYNVSTNGVKSFQKDNGLNNTGKIDSETVSLLIQVFDNDTIQDILTHIDRAEYELNCQVNNANKAIENTKKNKKSSYIVLAIMIFFEVYGIVMCWVHLYNWFWSIMGK